MAKNVKINGVTYSAVPSVNIPLSSGSGSAVFYDTSDANATSSTVPAGVVCYGTSGKVTGTATFPSVSQDGSTKVVTIS